MRLTTRARPLVVLLACTTVVFGSLISLDPRTALANSAKSKSHKPYADNAGGLKNELEDMLHLARKGKSDELRAMITALEIPDAKTWYVANFGPSGLRAAGLYQQYLRESQQRIEKQLIEFSREDGYLSVKKENPTKDYSDLITRSEPFLAAWEERSNEPEHPVENPFGYFFWIDGKFRWDSTKQWVVIE